MKMKRYLKKNKIDAKYFISVIVGIMAGVWIISEIQLLTGFYNDIFFLVFGCLYSYVIMKRLDEHLHSLKSGDKIGDKTNI